MKRVEKDRDDNNKIMTGTKMTRTLIRGTEASLLPQKNEQGHTHRWRAYVMGINREELPWIKKVVFYLHSSFADPERNITKPPYEICSTGWGEFQLVIAIHFFDNLHQHIEFTHDLRLFHGSSRKSYSSIPVINEAYEDLVISNPSKSFYNLLQQYPQTTERPPLRTLIIEKKQKEETLASYLSTATTITTAQKEELTKYQQSLEMIKSRINTCLLANKNTNKEISKLQREIKKLEQQELKRMETHSSTNTTTTITTITTTSTSTYTTTATTTTTTSTPNTTTVITNSNNMGNNSHDNAGSYTIII